MKTSNERRFKTYKKETRRIDHNTGELLETDESYIIPIPKEPPFIKLYLKDLSKLKKIPSTGMAIIHQLLIRMGYNNEVSLGAGLKREICDTIGIFHKGTKEPSLSSFNVHLSVLHKKGIMSRKAKGLYVMNPFFFGKGTWKDVNEIRIIYTYNNDGVNKKIEFDGK